MAKNHRNKSFDIYDGEDLENEVYIIANKILPEFNTNLIGKKTPMQALENWLNSSISKRLINFHRDKFVGNPKKFKSVRGLKLHQSKFNLMYPLNIEEIPEENFSLDLDNIVDFETKEKLLQQLDEFTFDILETYLSGETLPHKYKDVLFKMLKDFINDNG